MSSSGIYTPQLVEKIKVILQCIIILNEVTIERIGVILDHVHISISFKSKYVPMHIVKAFKDVSARMFCEKRLGIKQQQFWGGHLRSHSY